MHMGSRRFAYKTFQLRITYNGNIYSRVCVLILDFFLSLQPTSAPRVARRCCRAGQSRGRSAAGQTRMSGVRVAGNSTAQCDILGQGGRHVVAGRNSLHDACRTVSTSNA